MKWFVPLFALVAFLPQRGSAETTLGTAITTLPYTITRSGVYHFTKSLSYVPSTGVAIRIEAPEVVIDLNGHQLAAVAGAANTAVGIECSGDNRITVMDGAIGGFQDGVVLDSSYDSVTGLLVTDSLQTGISLLGNHSQISHNRVDDTGGAAAVSILYAIGISLTGTYGTVTDNDVQNTYATDNTGHFGDGIRIRGCSNIVVSNNRILDVEPAAPTKGAATGIAADSTAPSEALVFLGNTVLTTENGFDLSGGVSGKYGDNITSNITTNDYFTTGSGMTAIDDSND